MDRSATTRDPRRHDLDALRSAAMLLGIALHAALPFVGIGWVVQDRAAEPAFGYFVSAVHGFRMPLFFMMSGFFSMMLLRKRGLGGLLRHRLKRIALPLAVGLGTIVPLMWMLIAWSVAQTMLAPPEERAESFWTAASTGDIPSAQAYLIEGSQVDELDPTYRTSALGWAIVGDHADMVGFLLNAGADPNVRQGDGSTPLHTAAFFGRAESARLLLDYGADASLTNRGGEQPIDSMRHNKQITDFIAGVLQMEIDFEVVQAGRDEIRPWLEEAAGGSALERSATASATLGVLGQLLDPSFPLLHHLWFLWHLCWLIGGLAIAVILLRALPRIPLPAMLIGSPLALVWLVPLTAFTQSLQHGESGPAFGPDTSAGIVPMWWVLAHYTVFFGFGALVYTAPNAVDRLGRLWFVTLPLAAITLVAAMAFTFDDAWASGLVERETTRHMLTMTLQSAFAWLTIFGLIGLFGALLSRERWGVRYVSDSSYWLYLVHLPLLIVMQALIADWNLPAGVKFTGTLVVASAMLLVSYQLVVRHTLIGTMLNGPRARPNAGVGAHS